MLRRHRANGDDDLSEKSPLEMAARFLAGQAWSKEICRTPSSAELARRIALPDEERIALSRQSVDIKEFQDRHWREFIGPAKLQIVTCFKRPTRAMLDRMCDATGASADVVLRIWDAAVIVTMSEDSLDDQASNAPNTQEKTP